MAKVVTLVSVLRHSFVTRSFKRVDKGRITTVDYLNIVHGGNSTFINMFDKTKFFFIELFLPSSVTDIWKFNLAGKSCQGRN